MSMFNLNRSKLPSLSEPQRIQAMRVLAFVRHRAEWIALAGLLLLSLAVRLHDLGSFPNTINPDEADNAQDALRLMMGLTAASGVSGLDWKPQPVYSVAMISWFFQIFGVTPLVLRLPSALFGTLVLVPFYLLLRRQLSAPVAFAATLLFGMSTWIVHFSRSGWENIQIPFYTLGAMLCLLSAVDTLFAPHAPRWQPWVWFAGAGVFCALGLYGYFSGRLIYPLLLAFAPFLLWRARTRWTQIVSGYALTTLVMLVLFAPTLPIILANQELFDRRFESVFVPAQPEFAADPAGTLWRQLSMTTASLWDSRLQNNSRYAPPNQPWFDPITQWLVLAGMAISLLAARVWGRPETWLWWLLLLIGWISTQTLTTATPDGARGLLVAPALIFFAAVSLDWFAQATKRLSVDRQVLVGVLACLLCIGIAGANLETYTRWQASEQGREARQPYIKLDEFDAWVREIRLRALQTGGIMNVGEWRALQDGTAPLVAQPETVPPASGAAEPGPPPPIVAAPAPEAPAIAPENWPQPELVLGLEDGSGRLIEPRAVAADPSGTVYVVDSATDVQAIKVYAPDGTFLRSWGGPGETSQDGRFRELWAVAINQAGEVLALDAETGAIQVFSPEGEFRRRLVPSSSLYYPRAMVIGPDDTIYLADTGGARALAINQAGQLVRTFGSERDGAQGDTILREPAGIALAPDGSVLVTDAPTGVVRRYAADGSFLQSWPVGAEVARDGPRIAALQNGMILIATPDRCGVLQAALTGELLGSIGNCDSRRYLGRPGAVALLPNNGYAVTDLTRGAVLIFRAM